MRWASRRMIPSVVKTSLAIEANSLASMFFSYAPTLQEIKRWKQAKTGQNNRVLEAFGCVKPLLLESLVNSPIRSGFAAYLVGQLSCYRALVAMSCPSPSNLDGYMFCSSFRSSFRCPDDGDRTLGLHTVRLGLGATLRSRTNQVNVTTIRLWSPYVEVC